ncbi:MAG: ATP-binding protein [Bacteroidales bacterium]
MKNIALHILDIVQNSTKAGAHLVRIVIREDLSENTFEVVIEDDGCGMDAAFLEKVSDPYTTTRTTRKVGMGLSLLRQNAEMTEGSFHIESEKGTGTRVQACFGHKHIDRPALGDIVGVVLMLITGNPQVDFVYIHEKEGENFTFDTREVKDALEGIPLSTPEVRPMLKELLVENLKELKVLPQ